MKKILHVTNDDTPLIQDVMNIESKRYEVDFAHTLEQALLTDLYPYDAVVFNMVFRRGDFNNTGELGLYPIQLIDDPKGGELFSDMSPDNFMFDIRTSDVISGWIFSILARISSEQGDLGYRGGLATFTDMYFSEVQDMFSQVGFELKTLDDKLILPQDILYLNSFPEDISQIVENLQQGVERVANFYFEGPLYTRFLEGSNFSTN